MKRVIGIDFGNTITYKPTVGERTTYPDVLRVIKRMVEDPDNKVVIISKVNEEQMARVLQWIDVSGFYNATHLNRADIFFCRERHEKAAIARDLRITHHIDDRPEVMAHMDASIKKYLFNPFPEDVITHFNQLTNTKIVHSWLELEKEILGEI